MKHLSEEDILMAVARAQGVITKAAQQILKRDKHDGIRAVRWMDSHDKLFQEISEDCRMSCGVDDDAIERAGKLAGD